MSIAEKRKPWMKWWPSHDRAEPKLRLVSRAARSLWHDMLGLMHESPLIGYLLIDGKKITPDQLARVLGDDIQDLVRWLEELHAAGVYSETEDGVVYSRRMVRDAQVAEKGRSDIKARGGAWTKTDENSDRVPIGAPNSPPNRVPTRLPITKREEGRGKSTDLVGPGVEGTPEPTVSAPKGYPEDFEKFWLAYPRSPNMSKAEAGKSWAKLKAGGLLPDGATMARAVAGYRKFLADQSKGRKDPHPAAHAATWLNQRRFEGFLEAPAAPVGAPTVNTGPGWEADHPETWGQLRAGLFEMHKTDAVWQSMFANCRPNGSPYTLICPTRFDRDTLETKYAERLERLFKHPVKFEFSPPQPTEMRH